MSNKRPASNLSSGGKTKKTKIDPDNKLDKKPDEKFIWKKPAKIPDKFKDATEYYDFLKQVWKLNKIRNFLKRNGYPTGMTFDVPWKSSKIVTEKYNELVWAIPDDMFADASKEDTQLKMDKIMKANGVPESFKKTKAFVRSYRKHVVFPNEVFSVAFEGKCVFTNMYDKHWNYVSYESYECPIYKSRVYDNPCWVDTFREFMLQIRYTKQKSHKFNDGAFVSHEENGIKYISFERESFLVNP